MKWAVIDTETSGLFDFSKPADADGQPRLASLAAIILDEDLQEVNRVRMFAKPDGWEMSAEVAAINGLTTEYLEEHGQPIAEILEFYTKLIEDGHVIAAYNAQYDTKVLRGELRRLEMDDLFERTPNVCVMRPCTAICKIPRKNGRGLKFPKLAEACKHFEIELSEEHTEMGDALAAAEILRKLHELEALPEPQVHYAKNRPEPSPTV